MVAVLNSPRFWQFITLSILILFAINKIHPGIINVNTFSDGSEVSLVKSAHASEIYPKFTCPCCGQPLNKEKPCCGAMEQMINYIDEQVELGKTKDEIILATTREFGLDRLIDDEDRLALKQKLADLAPADAPRIEIKETSRDLGTVNQKQGVVTTDFEFGNSGKSDLLINKLSSSCGCTSANIIYEGKVGPKFSMEGHGQQNPTDWEISISPGDKAILRIYYDPRVHPDLVGAVTRTVSILSNDPVEFEKQVTITLEQTK